MRLRAIALLLCLLLLCLYPALVLAWGETGHRIVGELAERRLGPAARAAVADLLAGEPEPSLAGVSIWADRIRDQEQWRHTYRWHFLNVPTLACRYVPPRDCPAGNCIVGAIAQQAQVLGDASRPHAERAQALKFVVHFVGDVHQPLHAGLARDRGGNDVRLRYRGQDTNLHRVWDSLILDSLALDSLALDSLSLASPDPGSPSPNAAGSPPPIPSPDWRAYADRLALSPLPSVAPFAPDAIAGWALESCGLIDSAHLYPQGTRRVSTAYLDRNRPLAEQRLRLAAARLADLLESALAGSGNDL